MIDLEYEKNRNLTTEQICIIVDFAIQAANDGGFLNSFIFERALCVFAAQILFPDKKDDIASSIGQGYDIRLAFDLLVKDGTVEKLQKDYAADMQHLQEAGQIWFEEVETYEHSARGLLDTINTLSGDIVQSAVQQLQKVASGDAQVVQDFANKWGFNLEQEANKAIGSESIQESLKIVQDEE